MAHRLAALLIAALCACGSVRRAEAPSGVDPTFEDALRALRSAVEEREDDLARTILDLILAREPAGATLEHAQAFERILSGRALARGLSLRLESVPASEPGQVDLVLHASHRLEEELVLRCGGGRLSMQMLAVDERGRQQTVADALALDDLRSLRIPPGTGVARNLGTFPLDVGSALAVRIQWSLRLGAGEFVHGGQGYPAMLLAAQECEAVRLAGFLPAEPVEPEVLAAYLASARFNTPAMLERAVRIEPHRREEALDLLAPVVAGLDLIDLERVVPALRWLSGHLGGMRDPAEWVLWMQERERRRTPAQPADPLDLPETLPRPDALDLPSRLDLPAAILER